MARFFLKRHSILRSSKDIEFLFDHGAVYKSVSFDIFFHSSETTKVLFAASKKIRPHVLKNRAKRLVKELYRQHQSQFDGPLYMALIAKTQILTASPEELNEEFRMFLLLANSK